MPLVLKQNAACKTRCTESLSPGKTKLFCLLYSYSCLLREAITFSPEIFKVLRMSQRSSNVLNMSQRFSKVLQMSQRFSNVLHTSVSVIHFPLYFLKTSFLNFIRNYHICLFLSLLFFFLIIHRKDVTFQKSHYEYWIPQFA